MGQLLILGILVPTEKRLVSTPFLFGFFDPRRKGAGETDSIRKLLIITLFYLSVAVFFNSLNFSIMTNPSAKSWERIQTILQNENLSSSELSYAIGLSSDLEMTRIESGQTVLTPPLALAIHLRYPRYPFLWLLTGEKPILPDNAPSSILGTWKCVSACDFLLSEQRWKEEIPLEEGSLWKMDEKGKSVKWLYGEIFQNLSFVFDPKEGTLRVGETHMLVSRLSSQRLDIVDWQEWNNDTLTRFTFQRVE